MTIPLVDLARQHEEVESDIAEGFAEVLRTSSFIRGPVVGEFEREFASFCEVEQCVGVGSGTDALELALRALGVGPGDRVIVPTNSFIASALAVLRAGADVVLVDSDPETHLIDVKQVADRLDARVRALMPVHLYGQMAPVEELREIAPTVPVLEDAAQSQGARRHGRRAGSVGDIAGTSFYPGKNIGAYGDGGAVLTADQTLADRVRALGNWGSGTKYHHPEIGFNSRLDSLQAVVLRAKLRRLEQWNEARRLAAARYDALLAGVDDITLPVTLSGNEHVWHLYVVRVPRRNSVLDALHEHGIGAGIHYPVPIHLQGAMAGLGHRRGDFPVAEAAADQILSLPLFPGITTDEQERVAKGLIEAVRS